jgi:hypothetical protein
MSPLLGPTVTGQIPVNVAMDELHTSRVRGLPETDVVRVQRWCQGRVPEHIRDEVRVEVVGRNHDR